MGEPDLLSVRTAPLPVYMLLMTGLILVAGWLLIYEKKPVIFLLIVGATILAGIYVNPAYASLSGQFVVFGIVLLLIGQVLAWLLNSSSGLRKHGHLPNSPSWIHRLKLADAKSLDTQSSAEVGSSKYRSVV